MGDIINFPKYGNTGFPEDMMEKTIAYINKEFETNRLMANYVSQPQLIEPNLAQQIGVPEALISAGIFSAAMDYLATQPGYKKEMLSATDYTLQKIKLKKNKR